MGIGLHGGGVGVIKFLASQGARVLATDLRSKEELKESLEKLKDLPVEYVFGEHRMENFIETDMVIKNPGVPEDSEFLKASRDKKIPIESDIGIFFELCPAPIIGVTGTKGKSTTAALLANILKKEFPQVILAGNIRASVLEKLPEITKDSIVILELSSWQLADAKEHKKGPRVAVITNILRDHLNRYRNFESYIADKKLIFKFQRDNDYLFLNFCDPLLKESSKEVTSRIYFYSHDGDALLKEELPRLNQKARIGAYLKGKKIYYGAAHQEICSLKNIKLIGRHNLANVLAAVSVADLYNVPPGKIKLALHEFTGLEGRLQLIKETGNVKYINDTAATTPDAAIAAVNAVEEHFYKSPNLMPTERCGDKKHGSEIISVQNAPKKIILISGGADKKLDFTEFGEIVNKKVKHTILLPGSATEKIKKAIDQQKTPILKTSTMANAVRHAQKLASPGNIVLLSPGCASFGLFRHEFERGKVFNDAVAMLKNPNVKIQISNQAQSSKSKI